MKGQDLKQIKPKEETDELIFVFIQVIRLDNVTRHILKDEGLSSSFAHTERLILFFLDMLIINITLWTLLGNHLINRWIIVIIMVILINRIMKFHDIH